MESNLATKRSTGRYATLSHCWGKTHPIKLIGANEERLKEGIFVKELPATFRDAVRFVRCLCESIRYIWIDSLCIRQDDAEDWAAESVRMYDVYRNSYLNSESQMSMF